MSPRPPVPHVDHRGALGRIPGLAFWELSQVPGVSSGCWCQQSDPGRLWKGCGADKDKHFHGLFSVKQLQGGEAVACDRPGSSQAAGAFKQAAGGGGNGKGPRRYLIRWKPGPHSPAFLLARQHLRRAI